jgi:hypothetical protein
MLSTTSTTSTTLSHYSSEFIRAYDSKPTKLALFSLSLHYTLSHYTILSLTLHSDCRALAVCDVLMTLLTLLVACVVPTHTLRPGSRRPICLVLHGSCMGLQCCYAVFGDGMAPAHPRAYHVPVPAHSRRWCRSVARGRGGQTRRTRGRTAGPTSRTR